MARAKPNPKATAAVRASTLLMDLATELDREAETNADRTEAVELRAYAVSLKAKGAALASGVDFKTAQAVCGRLDGAQQRCLFDWMVRRTIQSFEPKTQGDRRLRAWTSCLLQDLNHAMSLNLYTMEQAQQLQRSKAWKKHTRAMVKIETSRINLRGEIFNILKSRPEFKHLAKAMSRLYRGHTGITVVE